MQVKKDTIVTFDYTLKDEGGNVIDSSKDHGPLSYVHGSGNIIPGLENGLEGKSAADSFVVTVSPEEGYGERDESLTQVVDREVFGLEGELEAGMQFQAPTENGVMVATVVNIDDDDITVDGNHPLAGIQLNFDVTIVDVREATAEELDHGHVHGEGGCGH
jgi:FKBP-type peptidyl-prolyl cis-trans isomerase SlyD